MIIKFKENSNTSIIETNLTQINRLSYEQLFSCISPDLYTNSITINNVVYNLPECNKTQDELIDLITDILSNAPVNISKSSSETRWVKTNASDTISMSDNLQLLLHGKKIDLNFSSSSESFIRATDYFGVNSASLEFNNFTLLIPSIGDLGESIFYEPATSEKINVYANTVVKRYCYIPVLDYTVELKSPRKSAIVLN